MDKILVSACLLGDKTRYDGGDNKFDFLDELSKKYELIPFCPEMEAGLGVPRSPAEILRNEVFNKDGVNLTKLYNESAEKAYRICQYLGIKIAILKDGSPSCGSRTIYDGKFQGNKIPGLGVTARLLIARGIRVYTETDNLDFLVKEREKKERVSPIETEQKKYLATPKVKEEVLEQNAERRARRFAKESGENGGRFFHKDRSSFGNGRQGGFRRDRSSFGERKSYGYKRREGSFSRDRGEDGERRPYSSNRPFNRDRKPYGEKRSFDHKPYGEKRSFDRKPYGDKKPYGERKSFGKKPYGEKRSFDRKPYGDKPFKKFDGEKKGYGAKKSYGGRPSFHKGSYGAKKNFHRDSRPSFKKEDK